MENLNREVMGAVARAVPMDLARIKPNSTFDDLMIDSLDVVNIAFELEVSLDIRIPEEFNLSELNDMGQLTGAMEALLAEADVAGRA